MTAQNAPRQLEFPWRRAATLDFSPADQVMSKMDDYDLKTTRVTIFGEEYVLKSGESEAYAREISRYVDRRMKQIAREMNISDPGKIAIMAALEIADHLFRYRQNRDADQTRAVSAVARLGQFLDGVLKDGEAA
jgi:cell division protein ZapA (FtsZ GTPase activity inhibitor)